MCHSWSNCGEHTISAGHLGAFTPFTPEWLREDLSYVGTLPGTYDDVTHRLYYLRVANLLGCSRSSS